MLQTTLFKLQGAIASVLSKSQSLAKIIPVSCQFPFELIDFGALEAPAIEIFLDEMNVTKNSNSSWDETATFKLRIIWPSSALDGQTGLRQAQDGAASAADAALVVLSLSDFPSMLEAQLNGSNSISAARVASVSYSGTTAVSSSEKQMSVYEIQFSVTAAEQRGEPSGVPLTSTTDQFIVTKKEA